MSEKEKPFHVSDNSIYRWQDIPLNHLEYSADHQRTLCKIRLLGSVIFLPVVIAGIFIFYYYYSFFASIFFIVGTILLTYVVIIQIYALIVHIERYPFFELYKDHILIHIYLAYGFPARIRIPYSEIKKIEPFKKLKKPAPHYFNRLFFKYHTIPYPDLYLEFYDDLYKIKLRENRTIQGLILPKSVDSLVLDVEDIKHLKNTIKKGRR